MLRLFGLGASWYVPEYFDFRLYYESGLAVRRNIPLYPPPLDILPDSANGYLYPPIVALLFVPFTYLDPTTAGHLFNLLSIIFVIGGLYKLVRAVAPEFPPIVAAVAGIGVLFFYSSWPWIQNGQITGVIVGSITFASARVFRDESGGEFLAIAPAIKTFYLPVGAPLLWNRKALGRSLAIGAIVMILSVLLVGMGEFISYLELIGTGKGWSGQVRGVHTYLPFRFLGSVGLILAVKVSIVVIAAFVSIRARDNAWPAQGWGFVLGCATVALAVPAPLLYNTVIVYPAFLVALLLTYQMGSGDFGLISLGLLLTQLHALVYYPIWHALTPLVVYGYLPGHWPVLHIILPAQWGILLLYVIAILYLVGVSPTMSAVGVYRQVK